MKIHSHHQKAANFKGFIPESTLKALRKQNTQESVSALNSCLGFNAVLKGAYSVNPDKVARELQDKFHINADFGNKYEIMNLFTKAVQNGNDPMIVSSQINSAAYYGRNTPQSTYSGYFGSLFRLGRFLSRRRF